MSAATAEITSNTNEPMVAAALDVIPEIDRMVEMFTDIATMISPTNAAPAPAVATKKSVQPSTMPADATAGGAVESVRTALAATAAGREHDHPVVRRYRFALAVLVGRGHPEQLVLTTAADGDGQQPAVFLVQHHLRRTGERALRAHRHPDELLIGE